ncbi:MAG: hypothetical protein BWY76_02962 [bacterium ADurb.Bin429]|nr:MAG: hypothetical protein BWY76_02962 [bacterium ADurb.Bin429]
MPVFRIIVPMLLLLAGVAGLANPDSGIGAGLGIGVIVFALLIEAGINAFILLFASMNFGAVFLALALSNLLIYPLVFRLYGTSSVSGRRRRWCSFWMPGSSSGSVVSRSCREMASSD